MSIPLLQYKPSSQNQRVPGYEVPNEDTPRIYRLEDSPTESEIKELIWAGYRQIFSEHENLQFHRQKNLESQLKNRAITVRDFIRGLAKSEAYRRLVVETNSNYRIVEITLKRILGRAPYNKDEEIAWSITIATKGFSGFVDALVDSEEYQINFGDNTVPYQRRRFKDRPFNLVTPRYGDYWRDKQETERYKWGDINNFLDMAKSIDIKTVSYTPVSTANIQIPDTTRKEKPQGIPVSISPSASFPVR
ncbi:phycobilisome rod-core linker polypeptide CpcG2 [Fischerella thermalis CCMEE 5205]|uniref:Phycobilisome rod-core linker polypeptide CpcG2 n=1 Tax=Fischerella thermalis CCMEE 5318 TaxID=2019666 RepID=A0A2N6LBD0_9CYAN|nr:phycobilisome rod-core linker polypeptide [Fischerella thermalis]PMB19970.1 phycobilisome rod-core linker polypeptide CpcG2 [Fischerella thermalis CCMEE 5318]PMB49188.1 phycobilisome rod-core linker polypeptide CpcG2 [Fischerella thermalis CCMEE 5205]